MTFTKRGSDRVASRRAPARATGEPVRSQVLLDERADRRRRPSPRAGRSRRAPCCSASRNVPSLVEHVGDAAAHAGGEVAPGRAEHDDAAAGHVLAAVVADALDDGAGARVAHREALAREAAEERPAGGRAVEHGVADDRRSPRRRSRRRRAAGRRACRRRGPCRCSRWRRRRASSSTPGASQAPKRLAGRAGERDVGSCPAGRPARAVQPSSIALREQAADACG